MAEHVAELTEKQKARDQIDRAMGEALRPLLLMMVVLLVLSLLCAAPYQAVGRDGQRSREYIAMLGGFAMCAWLLSRLRKKFGNPSWPFALMISLGVIFMSWIGFTQLALSLNGALDRSAPRSFRPLIMEKHSSRGRGGVSHFLILQDWKDASCVVEVQVSEARFNQVRVGEPIEVETKPGALGIEWIVRHS